MSALVKIILFELILAKIDKYRLVIRYIWGTTVQICLSFLLNLNYLSSPFHILGNMLQNIILIFFNLWQQQYGGKGIKREMKHPERLCMQFYNLVFDHFREQRSIRYYADKLRITSNYLAMIVRQVCHETPKEAIVRQVLLEMKHQLVHTELTAEQMALRLHFADTSYMCRFFRKHTGMSVSKFRNSING